MLLYTESLVPVPENDLDLELVAVNNHDAGFRPITMNIFGAILGLPGVICVICVIAGLTPLSGNA